MRTKIEFDLNKVMNDWHVLTKWGNCGPVGPSGDGSSGTSGSDLGQTNEILVNDAFARLNNRFLIPFGERAEAEAAMLKFVWSLPKWDNRDERPSRIDVVGALKIHSHHVANGRGGLLGEGLPDVLERAWLIFTKDLEEHARESYRSL
jgi:hypothetical protein